MKQFKKIGFILCIAAFLTGCAHKPPQYNSKIFNESTSNKGVVILHRTEPLKNRKYFTEGDAGIMFIFKKLGDDKEYKLNYMKLFTTEYNYSDRVIMLDPGIYYIDEISLNPELNTIRFYKSPGIKILKKNSSIYIIKYGAFEVKSNQVTYLGHLKLTPYHNVGKLPFCAINEMEKLKRDLRARGYFDLAKQVVFEKFYNIGSLIVKRNNSYQIIDGQKMG